MGRKKSGPSHLNNVRTYRLTITYQDGGGQRTLEEFRGDYMAGARVQIREKVFPDNGRIWVAPEVELTMPKQALTKTIRCQTLSSQRRKSYSRHDK